MKQSLVILLLILSGAVHSQTVKMLDFNGERFVPESRRLESPGFYFLTSQAKELNLSSNMLYGYVNKQEYVANGYDSLETGIIKGVPYVKFVGSKRKGFTLQHQSDSNVITIQLQYLSSQEFNTSDLEKIANVLSSSKVSLYNPTEFYNNSITTEATTLGFCERFFKALVERDTLALLQRYLTRNDFEKFGKELLKKGLINQDKYERGLIRLPEKFPRWYTQLFFDLAQLDSFPGLASNQLSDYNFAIKVEQKVKEIRISRVKMAIQLNDTFALKFKWEIADFGDGMGLGKGFSMRRNTSKIEDFDTYPTNMNLCLYRARNGNLIGKPLNETLLMFEDQIKRWSFIGERTLKLTLGNDDSVLVKVHSKGPLNSLQNAHVWNVAEIIIGENVLTENIEKRRPVEGFDKSELLFSDYVLHQTLLRNGDEILNHLIDSASYITQEKARGLQDGDIANHYRRFKKRESRAVKDVYRRGYKISNMLNKIEKDPYVFIFSYELENDRNNKRIKGESNLLIGNEHGMIGIEIDGLNKDLNGVLKISDEVEVEKKNSKNKELVSMMNFVNADSIVSKKTELKKLGEFLKPEKLPIAFEKEFRKKVEGHQMYCWKFNYKGGKLKSITLARLMNNGIYTELFELKISNVPAVFYTNPKPLRRISDLVNCDVKIKKRAIKHQGFNPLYMVLAYEEMLRNKD